MVGDSCKLGPADMAGQMATEDGYEEGVLVSKSQGFLLDAEDQNWQGGGQREYNASRVPALEALVHAYVDKKTGNVINPVIGTCVAGLH